MSIRLGTATTSLRRRANLPLIAVAVVGLVLYLAVAIRSEAAGATPVRIVAAGDISTGTTHGGNRATSDLVLSLDPDRVLTLGDNQYPEGSLSDFRQYFDPTWGRFKDRISPTPGHHEYYTDPGATGYFTYFGAQATPRDPDCRSGCRGYYSYDLGNWHVVALNTNHDNCAYVACGPGSAQVSWLERDLAATEKPCILAYMADPRWSSGSEHGSNPTYDAIWRTLYAARADVVLTGHEHNYERFAKQNPDGQAASDGIREFTVGTGGNGNLYPFGNLAANSQVRQNWTLGVLELTLNDASYAWSYEAVEGHSFTDTGSTSCN